MQLNQIDMKDELMKILETLNPNDYIGLEPDKVYESDYHRGFIEAINVALSIIDSEL